MGVHRWYAAFVFRRMQGVIEDVCHMNGCHRSDAIGGVIDWVVVVGGRGDDRVRQVPKPQQVSADLGMGGAEDLALSCSDFDILTGRQPKRGFIFHGQILGKHQHAEVVQKPGGKGILFCL